jgi:hypothetical protein
MTTREQRPRHATDDRDAADGERDVRNRRERLGLILMFLSLDLDRLVHRVIMPLLRQVAEQCTSTEENAATARN